MIPCPVPYFIGVATRVRSLELVWSIGVLDQARDWPSIVRAEVRRHVESEEVTDLVLWIIPIARRYQRVKLATELFSLEGRIAERMVQVHVRWEEAV